MKNAIIVTIVGCCCVGLLARPASSSVPMQADADAIEMAEERIESAVQADSRESPGQVVVVYFTPRDRKPAADHTERIGRIVEETARFYETELERHGFADRSMHVLRNDDGEVEIVDVVGQDTDYDNPDGQRIRNEVVPVLRARGIDPDASAILLFCNLMDYDPVKSTISHHSPYYGGGSHLAGTAWQCDSEILDPKRFRDSTPIRDGEYGRITIGKHNSIFIGGVIHEFGHALSLPHCEERSDEATRGTALMGSGNRTYAQQLRDEGPGTFLTQAHALRLAAHPVFLRTVAASLRDRPVVEYDALRVSADADDCVVVQGRVSSNIPVHGVVAYFDAEGGGDYDATTATAVPDRGGVFAMRSEPLKRGKSVELRLVACHVNGGTSMRRMRFRVDEAGRPDLALVRLQLELTPMLDALRNGEAAEAERQLATSSDGDAALEAIGRRVLDRFADNAPPASIDPADIAAKTTSISLSRLRPTSARVGWIRPTYDAVPADERLLSIGGDVFARGLYAHAPAEHIYALDGRWKRLRGRCGVQASRFGRVDFEIRGDGEVLWSAKRVTAGEGERYDVDIEGVETLTLIVTDGGNGAAGDWGVWIEPELTR